MCPISLWAEPGDLTAKRWGLYQPQEGSTGLTRLRAVPGLWPRGRGHCLPACYRPESWLLSALWKHFCRGGAGRGRWVGESRRKGDDPRGQLVSVLVHCCPLTEKTLSQAQLCAGRKVGGRSGGHRWLGPSAQHPPGLSCARPHLSCCGLCSPLHLLLL